MWNCCKRTFSILGQSYLKYDRSQDKIKANGLERNRFSWRALWAFIGPGFLISIAYIDPGNITMDIISGARFNYKLLWIIWLATALGFLLQYLAGKLGTVTGYHLAELCRMDYGGKRAPLTIAVWILMELAVIAADIPEILGAAFAWYILSYGNIPLWAGVLISSIDTFALMGIQYFGVRYLEAFISLLVIVISVCFFVELGMTPVAWTSSLSHCSPADQWCGNFLNSTCPENYPYSYCGSVWGGLVPYLDSFLIFTAVSLFGAVVMPHNLYLHSGLALTRQVDTSNKIQIKWACIYSTIELFVSLLMSVFINMSVLIIAATMFYPSVLNGYQTRVGDDIGFDTAHELLKDVLGNAAGTLFAIALLASAHSSTITGTYAGQFVMEGFLNLKIAPWKRNLITRSVAIIPSLTISIVAGRTGATLLILISSMIMSIQLPFALVPLLKLTSNYTIMGDFKNSIVLTLICSVVALLVMIANCYAIYDAIFEHDMLHGAALIVVIIVVVIAIISYLGFIGYLVWRPSGDWLRREGFKTLQLASVTCPFDEIPGKSKSLVVETSSRSSQDMIEINEKSLSPQNPETIAASHYQPSIEMLL
jgi:Mn2+/Fe2+ NRAMP family transporter